MQALKENLEYQIAQYQGLLSLCKEEEEAIQAQSIADLLEILQKKQSAIMEIAKVKGTMEENIETIAQEEDLKGLLATLGGVLSAVLEKERENEQKLLKTMESLRAKLLKAHRTTKLHQSYGERERDPKFLDKRK